MGLIPIKVQIDLTDSDLSECYEQQVTAPSDLCNFATASLSKLPTPKREAITSKKLLYAKLRARAEEGARKLAQGRTNST